MSMEDHLRRKFGVKCKQGTIYKTKRRARLHNGGTRTESFAKLHGYAEVLKRPDPWTVVKFVIKTDKTWMRNPFSREYL